jgi:hypothetical protein
MQSPNWARTLGLKLPEGNRKTAEGRQRFAFRPEGAADLDLCCVNIEIAFAVQRARKGISERNLARVLGSAAGAASSAGFAHRRFAFDYLSP